MTKYYYSSIVLLLLFFLPAEEKPFIVVLGIAQDAGYPQIGCERACCRKVYTGELKRKNVSCLALVDPVSGRKWLFDATPDITLQKEQLNRVQPGTLSGIFLTHAHIGHYTGLMYFGREAMDAKELPVYAMPRMYAFLEKNGPWNQLVSLGNIRLERLADGKTVKLTDQISVTPVTVPHRDEYSETVGYNINAAGHSVLYIPDIDKWEKWGQDIRSVAGRFDYLFLDGSFYADGELPGRDMSEIPHPFVSETMDRFERRPAAVKKRIWFIHFNHTNPLLDPESEASRTVEKRGFSVAYEGLKIIL